MKRPMLICGITMIVASAFLIFYSEIASIVIVILAASAFILYSIKPLKLRKHIIIPSICIFSLILTLQFNIYTSLKIEPVKKYDQQIADISGTVVTLPESTNVNITLTLETNNLNYKNENARVEVILPKNENTEKIKLYNYISIKNAELLIPRNSKNKYDLTAASDGVFLTAYSGDATIISEKEKDVFYYCLSLKKTVSEKTELYLEENTAGILNGMLFGGSHNINYETLSAFRNGGIAHLLAVSGLHTSLWCGLLLSLLKHLKVGKKASSLLCIGMLLLLCIVSGFTPSVTRASLMMLVVLIAPFFKRTPDPLNSLGLSVTFLLFHNPYTVASISFQLSVAATFGVLLATNAEKVVTEKTDKIKSKPLRTLVNYTSSSFMVSGFASIFTMPVSAYYFGVFCIFSPITNLLCVQLAFYGMLSGVVATALSFINIPFVHDITIFLFRVTDFILSSVAKIAGTISEIEFCTIPIHKQWLFNSIIFTSIIAIVGYFIYKSRTPKYILKITAVLCAIILLFINIIPILPTPASDKITVISSGNNASIVIRSGLHYAYILNTTENIESNVYSYLPKATCEKLDYFIIPYATASTLGDISTLGKRFSPGSIHINEFMNRLANVRNIELPDNTITTVPGKYILNNKISIEIVDTYHVQYAIIKGTENTVLVHLHGNTDFSSVTDTDIADIFIYNGQAPQKVPDHAKTVIINASGDIYTDNNLADVSKKCSDVHITARDGDIQLTI